MLLAGDAAHLSPPFVGQGLGLGLRDVHQLAWKLADVLTGAAGDDLLDTYQAEREPHARALIGVARLLGSAHDRRRPGRFGAATGRARPPSGASRRSSGWPPTAARRPLRNGPLVERRGRAGRRLAGLLLPQPEVLLDGRPCRLDDVLGDGEARVRREGERLVVARADGTRVTVEDPSRVLLGWLEHGRAQSVVVRPDRIVRTAS